MDLGAWSALEWLALAEYELLLFAGFFFLLGAIDELAVDAVWLWLRASGRIATRSIARDDLRHRELSGRVAVLIPAWQESRVIGHTLGHALKAWPQTNIAFYIGCYRNDPGTLHAAIAATGSDPRVRLVVLDRDGPSTKADCLNRLYRAMEQDELRQGRPVRTVLLHDSEDMVDTAALALIDRVIEDYEFVQLPVLPMPQPASPWVASHYCEEFAEAHGKVMVVRDALRASIPAAGVGCAFDRAMLGRMSRQEGTPFADLSLTEDYELGLRIRAAGGRSRFLRVRGDDGQLVATRAYFPASLGPAVRQKSRWMHGIAFQGWDRLGWSGGAAECWMRLRDRRGPLSALVLFAGYILLVVAAVIGFLDIAGYERPWAPSPALFALLGLNMLAFVWRMLFRLAFTIREYGVSEGARAIIRVPLANIISIMAGRRAIFAYVRTLRGAMPEWEKTTHGMHPSESRAVTRSIGSAA